LLDCLKYKTDVQEDNFDRERGAQDVDWLRTVSDGGPMWSAIEVLSFMQGIQVLEKVFNCSLLKMGVTSQS
jgi:hypothetical protein